MVHVKVKAPMQRRCRCGMCFDSEGRSASVTPEVLARLRADPLLVVTEETPEAEFPTAPDTTADKSVKTSAKSAPRADKKAD